MSGETVVGFVANAITDARKDLVGILSDLLDEGRVQPNQADMPGLPRITLGGHRLGLRTIDRQGAQVTVATFPVQIDVDGSKRAQLLLLDSLTARVWDRCRDAYASPFGPTSSTPSSIDAVGAGTPSTRSQTITVDIPIGPLALCPPTTEDSHD